MVDAGLAGRLESLDLAPFNPTPACTRDGRISFRFNRPEGSQWLGRTSIPSVRAAALLSQFDPGQANVLLPALAEGTEAESLLETLGGHRCVFVWEPDPVTVRLALALHDYTAAITANRLILLCCSLAELPDALVDWLGRHPQCQCPNRLMMWPWQSPAELSECRSAVEAAWQEIARRRQSSG